MEEAPFSPDIEQFKKAVEVGDTNKIYFDPEHPEAVIRIPIDQEAVFLEDDPKLIKIAEKIYKRIGEMGKDLDIHIAPHQFIIAKETSDGPIKPMQIAKKIEGHHLVPIDSENQKTLDSLNRIVKLAFKYLSWIESSKPRAVVTDIFRPDQYIASQGETHDKLTLVDVEPRLKEREWGVSMLETEISNVVAPLRDTAYNETFNQFVRYVLQSIKRDRTQTHKISLLNIIVNFPDFYQQMAGDYLAERETSVSTEFADKMRNTPLIINKELLNKFGVVNTK